MKFIYPAIFSKDADGVFHGYFPDLEDCLSTGETLDEAIENANEAACNWLSVELEEDGHLPPVSDPADLELKEGEIGAFIVGNETYIKEYQEDGLHSLNPKYDIMRFSDEESVYLIGRVIGVLSPESIATEADVKRHLAIHEDAEK